jgi:hypothetical protein
VYKIVLIVIFLTLGLGLGCKRKDDSAETNDVAGAPTVDEQMKEWPKEQAETEKERAREAGELQEQVVSQAFEKEKKIMEEEGVKENKGGVVSEVEEKIREMHEKQVEKEEKTAPPEIAAELWNLIHTENYSVRWNMWPGRDAFYRGTPPHGALLSTYVNSIGYDAIDKKEKKLPPGTIIIKENYMPDKTLGAITVMYNLAGFDKENDNWFWVKYAPDGIPMTMDKDGEDVTLAGKVAGCIGCHTASNSGIDFIMTPMD